jgi:hypothetical protein
MTGETRQGCSGQRSETEIVSVGLRVFRHEVEVEGAGAEAEAVQRNQDSGVEA